MKRLEDWHRRWVEDEPTGFPARVLQLALIPLSMLYALLLRLRAGGYRLGLFPVFRAPVPVISVGNLAAGGTGKTPVVDYLVKSLSTRGLKVAVVSRGYGGSGVNGEGLVCAGQGPVAAPAACGDEPYLLARRNPLALVLVAPRRARGVAVAIRRHGAEVVVLDDGFQHLAVARDLDIVLLDAGRPLGNGRVLPAGRLREPPAALGRADLLVLTRERGTAVPSLPVERPLVRCRHRLSHTVRSLAGEEGPLADLCRGKAAAFAGIAAPERFFADLREQGLTLVLCRALADHAEYGPALLQQLGAAATAAGADFLVTTEKDGVKLGPRDFSLPCYQVPMDVTFADPGPLEKALDRCLEKERP